MTNSGPLKPKSVAETHQLMKVALGEEKADLTIVNATVVNVYTAEILPDLGISIKTVEKHRQNVMNKLNIHETAGLTRYAISAGLIESNVQVTII